MNGHIKLLWYWNNVLLFECVIAYTVMFYYNKVNHSV